METQYLFAYGGKSQHRGKALGQPVLQLIKKLARCIEDHPTIHYTVLFAAGKDSYLAEGKPMREVMKIQLGRELEKLRIKNIPFTEPTVTLIKSELCSVRGETTALALYMREKRIAVSTMTLFFSFSWLYRVCKEVRAHFPKALLPFLFASLCPGIRHFKLTCKLPKERPVPMLVIGT